LRLRAIETPLASKIVITQPRPIAGSLNTLEKYAASMTLLTT
jgi:hypothetical protein